MPYVSCPQCRLTIYTAAAWSTSEHCPRCMARLGVARTLVRRDAPPRAGRPRGGQEAPPRAGSAPDDPEGPA